MTSPFLCFQLISHLKYTECTPDTCILEPTKEAREPCQTRTMAVAFVKSSDLVYLPDHGFGGINGGECFRLDLIESLWTFRLLNRPHLPMRTDKSPITTTLLSIIPAVSSYQSIYRLQHGYRLSQYASRFLNQRELTRSNRHFEPSEERNKENRHIIQQLEPRWT